MNKNTSAEKITPFYLVDTEAMTGIGESLPVYSFGRFLQCHMKAGRLFERLLKLSRKDVMQA